MTQTKPETCPLCKDATPPVDNLDAQESVMDAIKEANPDWVAQDGACTRCWEEYAKL